MSPEAVASIAFPITIDQKSGIVLRAISTMAIEPMIKDNPHTASAKVLRCWSHESNKRHPAKARGEHGDGPVKSAD